MTTVFHKNGVVESENDEDINVITVTDYGVRIVDIDGTIRHIPWHRLEGVVERMWHYV